MLVALVTLVSLSACAKDATPSALAPALAPVPIAAQAAAPAAPGLGRLERKITRTADLDLEVDDPRRAQASARDIAEELGGYVATSDVARDTRGDEDDDIALRVVLRVPSERFSIALDRLKGLAARVAGEHVSSEDVTEEFIDLNAHIASDRALETQFVEILKQAKSVKDALEVHTHLAEVRSEIDKLEGRRLFLENQTSLSTIRVGMTRRAPVVRASWFGLGVTFKRAASDAAGTTAAILHGTIRVLGFALPIFAFVVTPGLLIVLALVKRARRARSQWSA
jgi:hypothetical protein